MKVKEENEKAVLKLNTQKSKIMASSPISSWQIDGKPMETATDFIFWASKSLQMVIATMELKEACSLEKKLWPTYTACWRRQWDPTPVLLPGKPHGRRSLVGCSPWGRQESDTTERLHFHFSLLWTGEGNGNPLQCSCLENPRDGGAW